MFFELVVWCAFTGATSSNTAHLKAQKPSCHDCQNVYLSGYVRLPSDSSLRIFFLQSCGSVSTSSATLSGSRRSAATRLRQTLLAKEMGGKIGSVNWIWLPQSLAYCRRAADCFSLQPFQFLRSSADSPSTCTSAVHRLLPPFVLLQKWIHAVLSAELKTPAVSFLCNVSPLLVRAFDRARDIDAAHELIQKTALEILLHQEWVRTLICSRLKQLSDGGHKIVAPSRKQVPSNLPSASTCWLQDETLLPSGQIETAPLCLTASNVRLQNERSAQAKSTVQKLRESIVRILARPFLDAEKRPKRALDFFDALSSLWVEKHQLITVVVGSGCLLLVSDVSFGGQNFNLSAALYIFEQRTAFLQLSRWGY